MVEDLIAVLAATFANPLPGDPDEPISRALERIGAELGAERSGLYLRSGGRSELAWRAGWRAEGVTRAGGPGAVLALTALPWLVERLEEREIVQLPRASAVRAEAAAEADLIGALGARSAVLVPLVGRGSLIGVLALEAVRGERRWEGSQIRALRVVGDLMVGAIERMRAEEARRRAEARLREAQRLEALGRIAGGVAHDFNNFLTAIIGNCELAAQRGRDAEPVLEEIEEIRRAAERASTLVDRILSFSHRRRSGPRPLDLGWVVVDLEKLIRCVVGDGIEVVVDLPDPIGAVRADPAQIEQVIVNLAVNARDAMPEGGTLSIRVREVEIDERPQAPFPADTPPGSYVALVIGDTGCGMDGPTRAHLFEPYFTTKSPGRGTGLGLASVLGIVRESGGAIAVESAPGRGSTFSVLLPRFEQSGASSGSRGETILVVEEQRAVRRRMVRALEREGYRVLEAGDDDEALRLCERQVGSLHLLVTDLALPHRHGPALARRLRCARPEMGVLYTSRHPEAAVREEGALEGEEALVEKPFTSRTLALRVREALDRGPAPRRPAVISCRSRIPRMPDVTSPLYRELQGLPEADGSSLGA